MRVYRERYGVSRQARFFCLYFPLLATAMFNGMFEVVEHDFTREDTIQYVKELQYFFNAGWDSLLGLF